MLSMHTYSIIASAQSFCLLTKPKFSYCIDHPYAGILAMYNTNAINIVAGPDRSRKLILRNRGSSYL